MPAIIDILSPWHILLIGIVAILLFGNRLPEVARSLGRSVNEFKRGLKDVKDEIDDAGEHDDRPKERLQAPADKNEGSQNNEETEAKKTTERQETHSQ